MSANLNRPQIHPGKLTEADLWGRPGSGCAGTCQQGRTECDCDPDEALAEADYESWAGPWWWRVCERYPAAIAVAAALLGMTPYFWRN